jgi:DNA-binding NtrC family response regulator
MLIRVGLAVKDNRLQAYLAQRLVDTDIRVEVLAPPRTVWQSALRQGCDVIVISEKFILHPVDNGIAILNELPENPTTIIIHDSDSLEKHAQLAAAGADVVLYAGLSQTRIYEAIDSALESRRQFIQRKRIDRRGAVEPKLTDFVMESRAMQVFMDEVDRVVASDSPILLTGETGVGKEHLAKAIHAQSPRSVRPFISVNMAAMPENLLESELFGHAQGAFTGALRYRRGAFELAHGGTIFLDEIGEMPLHLQTKLLRVLQDYEVKPLGSENTIALDVRVIAATNRNLEDAVAQGDFRQDLFYRLSVLMLTIPPLRHRREDIPSMVRRFVTVFRYKIGREVDGFSEPALAALCRYDWPGNVRELMNVIERAMLLCRSHEIALEDLPEVFRRSVTGEALLLSEGLLDREGLLRQTLPEVQQAVMDRVERLYLEQVLTQTRGRVSEAARMAGIHPRGLYNKMKRLGLKKEDFKL